MPQHIKHWGPGKEAAAIIAENTREHYIITDAQGRDVTNSYTIDLAYLRVLKRLGHLRTRPNETYPDRDEYNLDDARVYDLRPRGAKRRE